MINSHLFVFILLFLISALLYLRAKNTRKYYKCQECGEKFRVELMKANHCQVCGAPVSISKNSN